MKEREIVRATAEDRKVMGKGLDRYNAAFLAEGPEDAERLNLCVKDEDGKVIAGLASELFGECLHVEVLWVHEDHRLERLGSRLLSEAERVAREKGKRLAYLDTFDFQARDFYRKHGYITFGTLEGCPTRERCWYYMRKDLV